MDFEQYLKQELENNPSVCEEFNALQPEYEIIRKIIAARIELGLTQKELARKCGIKQSNISRLESGKANPTIKFLQKIAKALDSDLFIEFRKRDYSSESITLPQAASITKITIKIPQYPCCLSATFNESRTTKSWVTTAKT